MAIKNNIRKYRQKFKITQEDLAQELEATKQYVSKLELGKTIPGLDVCFRIINAFERITKSKSGGNQIVYLKLDDLFYEDELFNI